MFGNGLFETNAPPDMNRYYTASRPPRLTLLGRPRRLTLVLTARSSRVQTSSSREWRHGDCYGISGEPKAMTLARQPPSPRLTRTRNFAGF